MLIAILMFRPLFARPARHAGTASFAAAIGAVSIACPLALLAFAAARADTAVARAQIVVAGSERIVLVLGIALAARVAYGAMIGWRASATAGAGSSAAPA